MTDDQLADLYVKTVGDCYLRAKLERLDRIRDTRVSSFRDGVHLFSAAVGRLEALELVAPWLKGVGPDVVELRSEAGREAVGEFLAENSPFIVPPAARVPEVDAA